jgi:hypothetical protein
MFIRWKVRRAPVWDEGRKEEYRNGPTLIAHLVQSRRVDGRPRHTRTIYLGSIREKYAAADGSVLSCGGFWRDARAKLDALDLPPEERAKVEAALLRRVPDPTEEELAAARAESDKRLGELLAEMRGLGRQGVVQ